MKKEKTQKKSTKECTDIVVGANTKNKHRRKLQMREIVSRLKAPSVIQNTGAYDNHLADSVQSQKNLVSVAALLSGKFLQKSGKFLQ